MYEKLYASWIIIIFGQEPLSIPDYNLFSNWQILELTNNPEKDGDSKMEFRLSLIALLLYN